MFKVFTDEYIQYINNRYKQISEYEKPDIYKIAVSDEGESLRNEIEEMVAALSLEKQKVVIPRLTKEEHFTTTCNELAVGCLLRQLGYQVEYDKKIKGLTPDWYVYPNNKRPGFIVEVFTTDSGGDKRRKEDWQIKDLEGRLGKIAIDATLVITLDHSEANSKENKRITQEIKQWLIQENPSAGKQLLGNNFICEIVNRNTGLIQVKPFVAPQALLLKTEHLVKTIKEKVERYKNLEYPLVIAIVTDHIVGKNLRNILVGGRGINFYYNKITGTKESQTFLLYDGLFDKEELLDLSAVVWVSRAWSGWKMTAIYNPNSNVKKPLLADTFGEDCCPVYELGLSGVNC